MFIKSPYKSYVFKIDFKKSIRIMRYPKVHRFDRISLSHVFHWIAGLIFAYKILKKSIEVTSKISTDFSRLLSESEKIRVTTTTVADSRRCWSSVLLQISRRYFIELFRIFCFSICACFSVSIIPNRFDMVWNTTDLFHDL